MIDSHIHSKYSKHAVGQIEEIVIKAIEKDIKILTITDHAPFPIDIENRLSINELEDYFEDIDYVKNKYSNDIKILKGIEADFVPKYYKFTEKLLSSMDIDFVIGSIHSVFLQNERINVWDIEKLYNNGFISEYFVYLKELIESNLFDSIGHPDAILRGGILEMDFYNNFLPLIPIIKENEISYELNASGLRKSTYNIITREIQKNVWSFPSKLLIKELDLNNISFTLGSDSHSPKDVNRDVMLMLNKIDMNILNISYYENTKKISIIDTLRISDET